MLYRDLFSQSRRDEKRLVEENFRSKKGEKNSVPEVLRVYEFQQNQMDDCRVPQQSVGEKSLSGFIFIRGFKKIVGSGYCVRKIG